MRHRFGGRAPAAWRAALTALVLLSACHGEAEQAHRTEAGRIAHAVENLRNAPNARKAPYLTSLERMPCSVPDVCELKRTCVDAYQRQLSVLASVQAVRHELKHDAAPAAAASAAGVLDSAQKALLDARRRTEHCADLQGTVSRRYGL